MPKIEIYTTQLCPFCSRAKTLLQRKKADYEEIAVDMDPVKRKQMTERAGGRTSVPQIFIDGQHVGGCDDLYKLDYDDKLDAMLGKA